MRWVFALLLLALPAVAQAALLDKVQPDVAAGNAALAAGDAETALGHYEAAAAALPASSEAHHNRGNALYALGRHAEAREAWMEALAHRREDAGAASDYFQMGNALAQEGKLDEAMASYRRALEIEPGADDARRNLERLLRKKQQQEEQQQEQQQEQQSEQDEQGEKSEQDKQGDQDEQSEQAEQDEPDKQGKPDEKNEQDKQDEQGEGNQGEQDQQAEQDEKNAQPEPGTEGEQAQAAPPEQQDAAGDPAQAGAADPAAGAEEIERSDAVRLLDSLRDGERNFQLWRYEQKDRQKGTTDVDKAW